MIGPKRICGDTMSDAPVIVQICADSLTVVVLATIALIGRWLIFREAVALKKSLAQLQLTHDESMTTILEELAELKKRLPPK